MEELKKKLGKAKNALSGASADMKPFYEKQIAILEKKIKEFKDEPEKVEAVIETNAEIEALTKKLESARKTFNGASDNLKPVYQKQIDKLEDQIKTSLSALKKADTVSEIEKVEESSEKKNKEAVKTEKKVKTSKALINSVTKKVKELGSYIKGESDKYKKKYGDELIGFIDDIKDYYNSTFTGELAEKTTEQLEKLSSKVDEYKEDVKKTFEEKNKEAPAKKRKTRTPKPKESKVEKTIPEMSHEEKCAELIAKYEERRKKAKAEKDTRKPATKVKDKTEDFVENIYKGVVKLVEKGDITPKAIDTIINRLGELSMQLKALKKKM